MTDTEVPVLIIGAGPVGLSAATSLSRFGIENMLIEKHPGTSTHPKARGVNVRSMEIMRSFKTESAIRRHELPEYAQRLVWAYDFNDQQPIFIEKDQIAKQFSPTTSALVSQDRVEQELVNNLDQFPNCQISFSTELIDLEFNNNGVVATIKHRTTDSIQKIYTQYVIAADGAHSMVRNRISSRMLGIDDLGHFCSIYCEADLSELMRDKQCAVMIFTSPELRRFFMMSVDGAHKWIFALRYFAEEGLTQESFTREKCIELVKDVIGDPSIDVRLINRNFWTMAALNAEKYQQGRIFLAGDSAHRLPPTGGFGMNTGIQDAHNLAWKLAFVLNGWADDNILSTYQSERQAIATENLEWSISNSDRMVRIFMALEKGDVVTAERLIQDQHKHVNSLGLDLGFIYREGLVISDDSNYQVDTENYHPSGCPGVRAPHVALKFGHEIKSTLDFFDKHFVLLAGDSGWQSIVEEINEEITHPIKVYIIGAHEHYQDINNDFLENYQIEHNGAVLVRPDGHIAWRAREPDKINKMILKNVLTQLNIYQ